MSTTQNTLFGEPEVNQAPLASRLRPSSLSGFVGQDHILGPEAPLGMAMSAGNLHSFLLWGPPGVGKTTLARLCAGATKAQFYPISAVLAGVKDIRAVIDSARVGLSQGLQTVLFVDEVHRFNKAQQDAFLPHVEDGTITFIGATTENPSFEVNAALLSRVRVYRLRPLEQHHIVTILQRALASELTEVQAETEILESLAAQADGDARRALGQLEVAADLAGIEQGRKIINQKVLEELGQGSPRRFDKGGDAFYDQISALHKSVRGSDPDASLYWFVRMLDGGCDPLYIARRVVRMASEDIGNADPRALEIALNAWQIQERLGSPEGELTLAQAIIYLACAAKSNAVYSAFNEAKRLVETQGSLEVPIHLRNAPSALMREQGFGKAYRYAHSEPEGYAANENYFPEEMQPVQFYQPTDRGLEGRIREKLQHLRALDQLAKEKVDP
ncbi:replication-associated recombination protein A [Luminiphilus sp. nBUS_16]|uniref:replication-associated recombination protein A n=1 Tax=unclassified Luminiphilus TaxID=2633198 RepID=UPI003EB9DEE6